jgi:hypothetical protein
MSKVKSIVTEADIAFMKDVEVEFVSLVGHAANRQPFKIIKGEVKGDKAMPKQTIYSVLVKKGITEEKLQEIVDEHNFSVDEKDETALDGYDVYKQLEDTEVDLDTRKMATLTEDAYVIVADLKEESEKEGLDKSEFEYETMEKVADSLFAMMDIVLGTMRQPEAENRKEMIMEAVGNFSNYVEVALSNMKSEEILEDFEIKSEIIKEFIKPEKSLESEKEEQEEFDKEEFEKKIKEDLVAEFTEMLKEQVTLVKTDLSELKETLNTSLNEQFELYTKKEDVEKELGVVKTDLEDLKNTTKKRNSEIDEGDFTKKFKKTDKRETKLGQFKTFV